MISCVDICDDVVARLKMLGFDLGPESEEADHGRILDALADCALVPLKAVKDTNLGYAPKLCPDRQIDVEGRIADVLFGAFSFADSACFKASIEGAAQAVSRKILRQVLTEFRPDLFDLPAETIQRIKQKT